MEHPLDWVELNMNIAGGIKVMYNNIMNIDTKICKFCNKEFSRWTWCVPSRWKIIKFCSKHCAISYNKNGIKKGQHISPSTEIKKGQRLSPLTEFKIGSVPFNWKGDNVGLKCLHDWVKRKLGKPNKCDFCGTEEKKMYHWANKSGEYKRELNDWLRLCVPCHSLYDRKRRKNV